MAAPVAVTPEDIIRELEMQAHPEGGHYVQTWLDATEIWYHHAGAPLELSVWAGGAARVMRLGPNLLGGERPQGVVPAHAWQSARSAGAWTLVGCAVAPGFQFSGFDLAPLGWMP